MRPVVTIGQFPAPPRSERATVNEPPGSATPFSELPLPRPLFGGRLVRRRRPDVHFPDGVGACSSVRTPGRSGLMSGATLLGKHFIAYGFVQQWFKVGGDGRDTNQMNGVFNFTYSFENGWTIGTQPNLSVDWEAPGDERVAFSIGPQVGKICKCGGTADVVPVAGSVLPGSSRRRRSEVEHSAASDADDPGPHQENALLTMMRLRQIDT